MQLFCLQELSGGFREGAPPPGREIYTKKNEFALYLVQILGLRPLLERL